MRIFKALRSVLSSNNGGKGKVVSAVKRNVFRQDGIAIRKEKSFSNKIFGKYLLLTNTFSAGLLMVIGDAICQEIEFRGQRKNRKYNWKRTGQMFLIGCLTGPPHHFFYKWLDRIIPKASLRAVGQKILLEQLLFSPFCILTFFYGAGLIEKKCLKACTEEVKQKFLTVYATDWKVWPAVQYINFTYLPPQYRVIYVNGVTTMYNVFLSHIKHKDMSQKEPELLL